MNEHENQRVNSTAIAVAHCRAIESALEEPLIDDPYASRLVEIAGIPFSELSLAEVTTNRLISSVAIRSHFIDAALKAASPVQIVCLGLGLDTRPWRLNKPGDSWYGLDRGPTLSFMQDHMPTISPATTGKINFVEVDLTRDDWVDRLKSAGFDSNQTATWILEGVTMYLTDVDNRRLLNNVEMLSAIGSRLITVGFGPGSVDESQTKEVAARAAASGNEFRSIIDEPSSWLGAKWDVDVAQSFADYGGELGRPLPYTEDQYRPVAWLINARRT